MAPRKKTPTPLPDLRPGFRCGLITRQSIDAAAEAARRKPSSFLRERIEEWLQLNGYPVDPVKK
jgi:hypothetical protein